MCVDPKTRAITGSGVSTTMSAGTGGKSGPTTGQKTEARKPVSQSVRAGLQVCVSVYANICAVPCGPYSPSPEEEVAEQHSRWCQGSGIPECYSGVPHRRSAGIGWYVFLSTCSYLHQQVTRRRIFALSVLRRVTCSLPFVVMRSLTL